MYRVRAYMNKLGNPIFPLCTANASQADKKQARKDRHVTVPKKVTSSPTCHSMRARALPGPQTHPTNSPHVPIKAKIVINGSAQVNCRRNCFFLTRLLKDLARSNAGKAILIAHIAQRAAGRAWLDRSPA